MKKFQTAIIRVLTKKRLIFSILFFAGLLVFSAFLFTGKQAGRAVVSFTVGAAQKTITGEWTAALDPKKPGDIHLAFHRRSEKGGFNMTSDSVALSELQGLTAQSVSSAKTDVNFRLVREAGIFECEGFFKDGRGAGFWTFTPNQNFVSTMRARGYQDLTEEDFLRAAMHNLTGKFIEDLKSAGYDRLEFRVLLRAASHEITPKFIREMQSAGYEGLTMEELIRARNHEITSEYVKEVRAMGFERPPMGTLIRMRNHEITPEFISRMKSAGFENLSIEQLIRLKNHEVTPEFVNDVRAEGFPEISPETAIRLKNHQIDRDFIRRVKGRGFTNLTLEQIIRLRNQDIIK
jgi:uncharacterized protein (UPF0335 family)